MKTLFAAALAATFAAPTMAGDMAIMVDDPYARASGPSAKAGAAFMTIMNMSDTDDRLIAATSDVAQRVELHTHIEEGDGIFRMVEVEEGFEIPAGGTAMLARGGKHVMFMGLNQSFVDGETISVTLTFENAGDLEVEIPIDLQRKPEEGAHGGHGGHGSHSGHGDMKTN